VRASTRDRSLPAHDTKVVSVDVVGEKVRQPRGNAAMSRAWWLANEQPSAPELGRLPGRVQPQKLLSRKKMGHRVSGHGHTMILAE